MVSDKLLATAISVVPMLVGLGMIYRSYTSRKLADTMAEKDPTPIGTLQPGDGLVELEGRARADDERSAAPMLDTEGVAVTTNVERRDIRDAPGDQPGQRTVWNTVHSDRTVHDFSVEDDTGSVPVDIPSDGELNIAIQTTTVGKTTRRPHTSSRSSTRRTAWTPTRSTSGGTVRVSSRTASPSTDWANRRPERTANSSLPVTSVPASSSSRTSPRSNWLSRKPVEGSVGISSAACSSSWVRESCCSSGSADSGAGDKTQALASPPTQQ